MGEPVRYPHHIGAGPRIEMLRTLLPGARSVDLRRVNALLSLREPTPAVAIDDINARRRKVQKPRDVWNLCRRMGHLRKEHLRGVYLDAQNNLLALETISIGNLNTTRTHPREILFPAVAHVACGFILVHNHPSGSLNESPEDVEFTQAVRRAGELMGIELYDHVIVAGSGYISLRERGLL